MTAIVLAAGQGSRFRAEAGADHHKFLAACVGLDGVSRPVIEQVLRNLPERVVTRWLVTSPERGEVIRLAEAYGCQVVLLDSSGMGDSIAAAVKATAGANGWLVLPADLPLIQASTLQQLALQLAQLESRELRVIQPFYQGQKGHPVAFSRAAAKELAELSGDLGAASIVRNAAENQRLRRWDCDDIGCVLDVDTVQALEEARRIWQARNS